MIQPRWYRKGRNDQRNLDATHGRPDRPPFMIAALAWTGRHGSLLLALGVFTGLLIPPLPGLLTPLLIPSIVGPFVIALIRLDWTSMDGHIRQPLIIGVALLWLLIAAPLLLHAVASLLSLEASLHAHLVLIAAASPLMASASLALIIGLDASFAVVLTLLGTALVPLTVPMIALHLLGIDISMATGELMMRLGLLIGGSFALAWMIRRHLPSGFADRHAAALDGLAIIGLLVFAVAIMEGVSDLIRTDPTFVLTMAAALFGLNVGMQLVGALVFAGFGLRRALSLGLCSGNRNMGILLAAMADRATMDLTIMIALAQFPIYILPMAQRWLYHCLEIDQRDRPNTMDQR